MRRVLPTRAAVLAQLEPFRTLPPVLRRAVVAALTFTARQRDDVSHVTLRQASGPCPLAPRKIALSEALGRA